MSKFYFIVDRIALLDQAKKEFIARGLAVRTVNVTLLPLRYPDVLYDANTVNSYMSSLYFAFISLYITFTLE